MMYALEISSNLEEMERVEELVETIAMELKIDGIPYSNLLVTLVEATTNAIIHGNKYDLSKIVKINAKIEENLLLVSVQDEGLGFDALAIPDPTALVNRDKPHGRGIFLMRKLTDNIEFNDNGRRIDMTFNFQRLKH